MTTPNGTYMGASDAFSWRMERDPVLRPPIIVAVWLDRAPAWDALVTHVDRVSRLVPALRQRVVDSPVPVIAPRWTYRTAGPSSGAMSPQMRERATARHLAMMRVSLDALKAAATASGGTVNDAYLAVVTGGLRKYHERHGTSAESLRAVVPVNLRDAGDTGWGNKITLQRLIVPVGETDPGTRIRTLHGVTRAARSEPSLPVTGVIAGALNLLPVGYVGGILKHVDFLASNVAGPPAPVYLAGGKVTGLFAFGPTIGAALNTTLLSYAGTCHIGVNIDTAAVPDPDVLLACLEEGLTEVTALGAAGPVPARPADGPAGQPSEAPPVGGHAAKRGDHEARGVKPAG